MTKTKIFIRFYMIFWAWTAQEFIYVANVFIPSQPSFYLTYLLQTNLNHSVDCPHVSNDLSTGNCRLISGAAVQELQPSVGKYWAVRTPAAFRQPCSPRLDSGDLGIWHNPSASIALLSSGLLLLFILLKISASTDLKIISRGCTQ